MTNPTETAEALKSANQAIRIFAEAMFLLNRDATDDFYASLFGGQEIYTLHPRGDINDPEGFGGFDMHFVDAESDPMTVSFETGDGTFSIHTRDHKYVMLTTEQIKMILFAEELAGRILVNLEFIGTFDDTDDPSAD